MLMGGGCQRTTAALPSELPAKAVPRAVSARFRGERVRCFTPGADAIPAGTGFAGAVWTGSASVSAGGYEHDHAE